MKILIVDDEESARNGLNILLNLMFKQYKTTGYETETAENGKEALKLLKAKPHEYALILLDQMMPGLQGLDVLKAILTHPTLQWVPVIFQTALTGESNRKKGETSGAFAYFEKPIKIKKDFPIIVKALEEFEIFQKIRQTIHGEKATQTGAQALFGIHDQEEVKSIAHRLAYLLGMSQHLQKETIETSVKRINTVYRMLLCIFEEGIFLSANINKEQQKKLTDEGGEENLWEEVRTFMEKQSQMSLQISFQRKKNQSELILTIPSESSPWEEKLPILFQGYLREMRGQASTEEHSLLIKIPFAPFARLK